MPIRLLKMLVLVSATILTSAVCAVPEADYPQLQPEITSFVGAKLQVSEFRGAGDKKLAWGKIPGDPGLPPIVISVGLGESYLHYEEFFHDMFADGTSRQAVFIFDLRSQGFSERLASDGAVMHVESFDDYVTDLEIFLEKIVRPEYPLPARIISHSTGGLIAFQLLSRRPELAEKIVFVAPLFGIRYGSAPKWLMETIAKFLDLVGYHDKTVPFRRKTGLPPFEKNRLTYSEPRYERIVQLQNVMPPPVSTGYSVGFAVATQKALEEAEVLPEKFSIPSLLLTADEDAYVSTPDSERFCARMVSCVRVQLSNARHVLLQERDEIRNQVLRAIKDYVIAPASQP